MKERKGVEFCRVSEFRISIPQNVFAISDFIKKLNQVFDSNGDPKSVKIITEGFDERTNGWHLLVRIPEYLEDILTGFLENLNHNDDSENPRILMPNHDDSGI